MESSGKDEDQCGTSSVENRASRQRKPNLIMEKWPVSDAKSFACFS